MSYIVIDDTGEIEGAWGKGIKIFTSVFARKLPFPFEVSVIYSEASFSFGRWKFLNPPLNEICNFAPDIIEFAIQCLTAG